MKISNVKLLLVLMVSIISTSVFAQINDLKVVIIRHAEKPKKGDNLNCQGLNRSMLLPKLLYTKFGVPAYTYVPTLKCEDGTKHARMFQTITPFAAQYNLTLNSSHGTKDSTGMATDIEAKKGTVLVVWDHKYIPSLVHAFGIGQTPVWSDDDYDSIWIITFTNGKAILTKDAEGLKPAADCK